MPGDLGKDYPSELGGAIAELVAELHPIPMRFVGTPDEFSVIGPTT